LHSGAFVINSTTVITLSNQSLLSFGILVINKDLNTAAGSPYFGNVISTHVNPSHGVVCYPPQVDVNSAINTYAYDPAIHTSVCLKFDAAEKGIYNVSITFAEKSYPGVYQELLHAYASITFQVNWMGY
jgi:hypothetical protein